MYVNYQMTYCTLNILMNLYIFYNASDILICLQTLCCILNNMSCFFHHVLLSVQHHMCYHHPIMIYMKMWNKQVIIYKEIHMNVLYMMTKKFTSINLYIVNMNIFVKWYVYILCGMIYAYHVVIIHTHCFRTFLCILYYTYL